MKQAENVQAVRVLRAESRDLEQCCDLVDQQLRGDAYIPRGQMKAILARESSDVWLVVLGEELCGLAIVYRDSALHNLILAPWARGMGVGARVLELLQPKVIRCKTNMAAGDPSAFYEANGFAQVREDDNRPHISVLERTEPFQSNEVKQVLTLLTSLFAGKSSEVPLQSVPAHVPQVSAQPEKGMVVVPQKELQRLQRDSEKWLHRKEKQRGYSRKRYEKAAQVQELTGEQQSSKVEINGY